MQILRNLFPFRESSQTLLYNNSFHIAGETGLNAKLCLVSDCPVDQPKWHKRVYFETFS